MLPASYLCNTFVSVPQVPNLAQAGAARVTTLTAYSFGATLTWTSLSCLLDVRASAALPACIQGFCCAACTACREADETTGVLLAPGSGTREP